MELLLLKAFVIMRKYKRRKVAPDFTGKKYERLELVVGSCVRKLDIYQVFERCLDIPTLKGFVRVMNYRRRKVAPSFTGEKDERMKLLVGSCIGKLGYFSVFFPFPYVFLFFRII